MSFNSASIVFGFRAENSFTISSRVKFLYLYLTKWNEPRVSSSTRTLAIEKGHTGWHFISWKDTLNFSIHSTSTLKRITVASETCWLPTDRNTSSTQFEFNPRTATPVDSYSSRWHYSIRHKQVGIKRTKIRNGKYWVGEEGFKAWTITKILIQFFLFILYIPNTVISLGLQTQSAT
jgi:hypothetical protein